MHAGAFRFDVTYPDKQHKFSHKMHKRKFTNHALCLTTRNNSTRVCFGLRPSFESICCPECTGLVPWEHKTRPCRELQISDLAFDSSFHAQITDTISINLLNKTINFFTGLTQNVPAELCSVIDHDASVTTSITVTSVALLVHRTQRFEYLFWGLEILMATSRHCKRTSAQFQFFRTKSDILPSLSRVP